MVAEESTGRDLVQSRTGNLAGTRIGDLADTRIDGFADTRIGFLARARNDDLPAADSQTPQLVHETHVADFDGELSKPSIDIPGAVAMGSPAEEVIGRPGSDATTVNSPEGVVEVAAAVDILLGYTAMLLVAG